MESTTTLGTAELRHTTSQTMRASAVRGRVHGIDAWRGLVLALLGIAFHGTFALGPGLATDMIARFIHAFRMEAFFAISGFLAFLVNDRPGWLQRRAITLMVPFAVMGVSIIVIRNIITHPVFWWQDTIHLWFLPVLMLCSFLPRVQPSLGPIIIAALLLSPFWLIHEPESLQQGNIPFWITGLITTPYYAVFYLAGHALASGRIKPSRAWMIVGVVALAVWMGALFFPFQAMVARAIGTIPAIIVINMIHALVALFATLAMFHHIMHVRHIRWPMPQLSRAAYTIYLFHLPILGALKLIMSKISIFADHTGWIDYLAVCAMTLLISLFVHYAIVARHPIMRFLLNGAPLRRKAPA